MSLPIADEWATKQFPEDYENPRKIPRVVFIESVPDTLRKKGCTCETLLRQMQEQLSKYKLMDHKLQQSKSTLASKIPEINKTISCVRHLQQKLVEEEEAIETHFGLTESVFVDSIIKPQRSIHLWLGANVMCEYSYEGALEMLQKNLAAAKANLASTLEDLAWVRDQTTILEVNVARVYNHDVISRRAESQQA